MNKLTPTDYPYLYLGSLSEARRSDEAGLWRASHQCNIACKQAIEAAIRAGFDGMHLKADCARGVIAQYGFKRVGWVLANTMQKKRWDGRFRPRHKEWADTIFIPACGRTGEYIVESHPAVLDGFVEAFLDEVKGLSLFDASQCDTLSGRSLEGEVLVLSPAALKESCWSPRNQLWLAESGFGCSPHASGRAIYATCLGDGEWARWNRSDFIGILRDECFPEWAKQTVDTLRKAEQEAHDGISS